MTTGLPIPTGASGPTLTAAPASAVPVAVQTGSPDFLIMLSQLLSQNGNGAIAAPAMSEGLPTAAKSDKDGEEINADECAGLAALLAFLPVMPAEPRITAAGGHGDVRSGISAILGQTAGGSAHGLLPSIDAKLLTELSEAPASDGQLPTDMDGLPFGPMTDMASRTGAPQADAHFARPVQTPVGNAAWADEIGGGLTMMAEQGRQSASLRLSPEHLGPLEVRIAVNEGGTSVWFGAAHADTRAAIEQALPRLREMFEAHGMSLTDAGVFREPPKQQQQQQNSPGLTADNAQEERLTTVIANARLGLIDAYA